LRFAFVFPRFHTNLRGLTSGLLDIGHEVEMYSAYKALNEDYSRTMPVVIASKYNIRFKGIPLINVSYLRRQLRSKNYDFLVVRAERNLFTVQVFLATLFLGKKIIIYDQYPLVVKNLKLKIFVYVRDFLFKPILVITPVFENALENEYNRVSSQEIFTDYESRIKEQLCQLEINRIWIPFSVNVSASTNLKSPSQRSIDVFISSKAENRKNVLETLHALAIASSQLNKRIVVEAAIITKKGKRSAKYIAALEKCVIDFSYSLDLRLNYNLNSEQMRSKYLDSKFMSLVSDNEPASFSNIESTAHGCINILSFKNGSISQSIRNHDFSLFTSITELPNLFIQLFSSDKFLNSDTDVFAKLFSEIFNDKKIANHFFLNLMVKKGKNF